MVMTQPALFFIGALAVGIGYLGLFKRFDDPWTPVLMQFASAITWAMFGLSSYDVMVASTESEPLMTLSEPILPLVYLGFGMAFIVALFAFSDLVRAFGDSASDASSGMLR